MTSGSCSTTSTVFPFSFKEIIISFLNSPLSDLVYIIDEPSVGLHPEDIQRINEIIISLKEKGNTVLVVEHDPDVIKNVTLSWCSKPALINELFPEPATPVTTVIAFLGSSTDTS